MVLLSSTNFKNVHVAQYDENLGKILRIFKWRQHFNLILMQVSNLLGTMGYWLSKTLSPWSKGKHKTQQKGLQSQKASKKIPDKIRQEEIWQLCNS